MNDARTLVAWLVYHAQRERDLVRLAMAFKVHKPRWGSHATLVAVGLSSYLQFIDWNLAATEAHFREWFDAAETTHSKAQRTLRAAQIKELADLVLRPRPVTIGAAEIDERGTPAAVLLPRLVNRGLLYRDVQVLAHEGPHSSLCTRILPDLSLADRDLFRRRHAELRHVTASDYVAAVAAGGRDQHPDVLLCDVMEHWSILARLGSFEFRGGPRTAAPGAVRDAAPDDQPTFVGRALEA